MYRPRHIIVGAGLVAAGLSSAVFAQALPPIGAGYDLSQLPETKGVVRQYTLTPRGDVDGLILQDGTEVHFPPHLGTQVVFAIKPNDAVSIRGLKARAVAMVDAAQIKNDATGATIVDNGPGPRPSNQTTTITSRVAQPLHGPRGEINGALLEDGTMLRMPPDEAARQSGVLSQGQSVSVAGVLTATPLGKVIEVTSIGATADAMTTVDRPPPPRGPRGPKG